MDHVETTSTGWTRVLTKSGIHLLANAKGKIYSVTHGAAGGERVPVEDLENLTEIAGHLADLDIVDERYTDQDDVAEIRLQLDNKNVKDTLFIYSIGVYAQLLDRDTQEPVTSKTLLMVLQIPEGEPPDIIRQTPMVTEYIVNTLISQTADVVFNVNHGAYVTIGMIRDLRDRMDISIRKYFQLHNEDSDSHSDIREQLTGIVTDWLPTAHIATIPHSLPYTPIGALFTVRYAAGIGRAGEHPAGGEGEEQIPCRLHPIDSNLVKVLTIPKYAGSPEVHRANDHEFALVYPDSDTSLYLTMR